MVAAVGVEALLSLLLLTCSKQQSWLNPACTALGVSKVVLPDSEEVHSSKSETTSILHACDYCDASFGSRNALFRHLRSDPVCSVEAYGEDAQEAPVVLTKQRVAFLFGYYNTSTNATAAGQSLLAAFSASVQRKLGSIQILGSTQSTITNSRAPILGIEPGCSVAEDVLLVKFQAPTDLYETKVAHEIFQATSENLITATSDDSDGTASSIQLHSCLPLNTTTLHAERCTQHVFHYMIPLRWLPDYQALADWYPTGMSSNAIETPAVLKQLKELFKTAESVNANDTVSTSSRFHSFARAIRRPWHNYADPSMSSQASPNQEPVWRAIDRARFHSFVQSSTTGDVYKVYEFSGDEFVQQQVRRLVGTVVAILNGWLPPDFLEISTQHTTMVETPLAPLNLLYRARSRFHYQERALGLRDIFDSKNAYTPTSTNNDGAATSTSQWMHTKLMARANREAEGAWLKELRETVAPRVVSQLEESTSVLGSTSLTNDGVSVTSLPQIFSAAPEEYTPVLQLLQDIVKLGQWPSTSSARSSVIHDTEKGNRGSFTVVNTNLVVEQTQQSLVHEQQHIPKANSLFPELAKAVFQLESVCAELRPPSSHCAINCNAQFTPHVDSGSGDGQTLSMIVGLGDYHGGELMVEHKAHDIRYQALQFDGWKLRHWTKGFVGQRFSLVWFTPEKQK